MNCARGELVDEAALLAALESGHVAAAGLDVFEAEPPADPRLVQHPNVIATPHIAGSTEEAQNVVGTRIAEQLRNYLATGAVKNAVNMPSVSPEEYKKLEPYIQLGEKLGTFVAQLTDQPISEVSISYDGGLADLNTHLVKNAVLKGVLGQILAEQINLINAGNFATARGIEVVEVRSARRAKYTNSLGVALRIDGESVSVLGMIGLNNALRILGVNNIDIDAPLTGFPAAVPQPGRSRRHRPRRHAAGETRHQHRQFRSRARAEFGRSHRHRQRGSQGSAGSAGGIARDSGGAAGAGD